MYILIILRIITSVNTTQLPCTGLTTVEMVRSDVTIIIGCAYSKKFFDLFFKRCIKIVGYTYFFSQHEVNHGKDNYVTPLLYQQESGYDDSQKKWL